MKLKNKHLKYFLLPLFILGIITFLNIDKFDLSVIALFKVFVSIIMQFLFLYGALILVGRILLARIIIALIYTVELFTQLSYGTSLSLSIIMSVLNTSISESGSFIKFNITSITIATITFFGIIFFKLPTNYFFKKIALLSVIIGFSFIVTPTLLSKHKSLSSKDFAFARKAGLARGESKTFTIIRYYAEDMRFRLRIINSLLGISDTYHFLSFQTNTSSSWSGVVSNKLGRDLLIIGIGESLRADNMSIYGYERETSPKLSSLKKELNVYNNAYSAGANTWSSIPASFTKAVDSKADISKSIVNLAKDAGYTVYWLSNQLKTGKWDFAVSAIAEQSDDMFFINEEEAGSEFDDALLTKLEQKLNTSKNIKKRLFILHYYGSHINFEDRYPQEFSKFKGTQNHLLNTYDNTVLYTDYVQAKALNLAIRYNGKYLFFADHGLTKANGELPLKHDLRDNPDINSLKVPFFTSKDDDIQIGNNGPISLFYFECIFSQWSGITAKELTHDNYCKNSLKKTNIKFFDANLMAKDYSFSNLQK